MNHLRGEAYKAKVHENAKRDVEITRKVESGLSCAKVAKGYDITPCRVHQIVFAVQRKEGRHGWAPPYKIWRPNQ